MAPPSGRVAAVRRSGKTPPARRCESTAGQEVTLGPPSLPLYPIPIPTPPPPLLPPPLLPPTHTSPPRLTCCPPRAATQDFNSALPSSPAAHPLPTAMAPPTSRRAVAHVTASTLLAAHSTLSAAAPAADMAAPPVAQDAPPRGVPILFPTTAALSDFFCFARPTAATASCAGGQEAPGVPPRGRPLLPGRHRRVDVHGRSVDHCRPHLSCRQRTGGDHSAAIRVARPHRDASGDRVAQPRCMARTTAPHWRRRLWLFWLEAHLTTCGPPLMESTARTAPPRRLQDGQLRRRRRPAGCPWGAQRPRWRRLRRRPLGGWARCWPPRWPWRRQWGGWGRVATAALGAADGGDRGDGGKSGVGGSGGDAGDGGSGGDVPGGRSGLRGAQSRDGQPGRPGRTVAALSRGTAVSALRPPGSAWAWNPPVSRWGGGEGGEGLKGPPWEGRL